MIIEKTLFGVENKVKTAIEVLKAYEPPEGYYVAFSGGKDSIVILDLVRKAGVKHDTHYNITGVDPPELVRFIKEYYPDVIREHIKKTMWQLIVEKVMPPTRRVRYCCEFLKERGGTNRHVITGVRKQESSKRAKRKLNEICFKGHGKRYLNIIIEWSEKEVWGYIRTYNLNYCKLYDEGWKRIGCIGCPIAGPKKQIEEFERWPKFKDLYIKSFEKMVKHRKSKGLKTSWENAEDVYNWWLQLDEKEDPDQYILFE
jgi:phosphoadenosine phosphosulfate reductase